MLERMQDILVEAGVPHVNQTAYRKKVSCADAMFTTQETIGRYMREGGHVYMCLYDLQKAFDSVDTTPSAVSTPSIDPGLVQHIQEHRQVARAV